jgi:uncharacterized protein (DUF885 family)
LFDELTRVKRALRLVIDTGIHSKRWTRQQAIDYMKKNSGLPDKDIETEVERYIVIPGQALSYKIGQLKILELRERAKQQLGESFDIRRFHSVVLLNGALPIALLEKQVQNWIDQQRNRRVQRN